MGERGYRCGRETGMREKERDRGGREKDKEIQGGREKDRTRDRGGERERKKIKRETGAGEKEK